ncbi:unnamed protein product [Urochloa decumbens]|uniref:F-box domain-containing protein n=1 Tax=Urochloa decumbens TaxID=240449 RepID=A0ABC9D510_9POAL
MEPDSETDVAKLSLEQQNTVVAGEDAKLKWKVEVLEAEVEKMKDEHLVQLKKKADVAEARQHTCTHILALPDDAIAEILLYLPQDSPSCLLRASLVCKLWLKIVSDLGFIRRLRALHPTPHVLGFFQCPIPEFVPTTASAFSLPAAMPRGHVQFILDCHHGRVLFLVFGPPMVLLIWEPVTGERQYVPMPEAFSSDFYFPPTVAVVCAADDCDHRGCHCHGGHFFLVLASATDTTAFMKEGTAVWVYSSETRAWGEPHLVWLTYCDSERPNTLVGRTVYLTFLAGHVLKYDLVKHNLVELEIAGDLLEFCDGNIIIIPLEDGRMGLASVKDSTLSLWSCDDEEYWAPHRVIGMDVPATRDIDVLGFAEGTDVIFFCANSVIFTIELKSERVRRLHEMQYPRMILPLVST